MAAYVVMIRDRMRDSERFKAYGRSARAARPPDGDLEPLASYGNLEVLEGAQADGLAILRFSTMEAARRWYDSQEYTDARLIRHQAADYRVMIVEGL